MLEMLALSPRRDIARLQMSTTDAMRAPDRLKKGGRSPQGRMLYRHASTGSATFPVIADFSAMAVSALISDMD